MALCTYQRKVISFSAGSSSDDEVRAGPWMQVVGSFQGPRPWCEMSGASFLVQEARWTQPFLTPCPLDDLPQVPDDPWVADADHDGWFFHTDFCTFTQKLKSRGERIESVRQSEGGAVWPKGGGLGLNIDSPLNTNAVSVSCLSFLTCQGRIRTVFTSWTDSEEKMRSLSGRN